MANEEAAVWGPLVSALVIALANLIAWAANENSWIFRNFLKPLRVRPLLFISNRASCVGKHARPTSYWAFDLLDPSHLVKSNCLSTPMLLVLHSLTFLYWVATVIVDVAIEYYRVGCNSPSCGRRHGAYGEWASYLTNWQVLKEKWDCLSCCHCIIMELATTAAFFVSFWFWVGIVSLARSAFSVNGGTMMAHVGNVVVALLQVVLTRLPMVSYHFQVVLWYATVYSLFLWVFGGATDIWRYGLDFQQARPAGVFIILPAVLFVMFLLWYFAALIREGIIYRSAGIVWAQQATAKTALVVQRMGWSERDVQQQYGRSVCRATLAMVLG
ncbi:hypothetical protein OEZ86_003533 [Tetradesmus obliquus]|nr:hypothetical protein OEZ86_003533 [Tetradesmus obliquus]